MAASLALQAVPCSRLKHGRGPPNSLKSLRGSVYPFYSRALIQSTRMVWVLEAESLDREEQYCQLLACGVQPGEAGSESGSKEEGGQGDRGWPRSPSA